MKQMVLRRIGLRLLFVAVVLALASATSWAANTVVIDSKTVQGGTSNVEIGVYLTNDVSIRNFVLPFTIRSKTGGSFITKLAVKRNGAGRLQNVLTGINSINGFYATAYSDTGCLKAGVYSPGFQGASSDTTKRWADTLGHTITGPPSGAFFAIGKIFDPALVAGTDGAIPSLLMVVDIANTIGTFEVDSTCASPTSHLLFVQDSSNAAIIPTLTTGLITVIPSAVQYLGGDGIPRDYSLDQNYPNPFNASTVIRFNTKHDGNVRLEVFNILGQRVKTLVDEFRHYGPQAADWDGTDMGGQVVPTGLYFYRLVTGDYTDVKKMVLLK